MKKYYIETKEKINNLIKDNKLEESLKIIYEELSMPYIPLDFEEFLNQQLMNISSMKPIKNFSISIEKIFDLLIKLDDSKNDVIELINQLNKFNLNEYIDEINYFFKNTKNKRHHLYFFEKLISQKVNINLKYGNPLKTKSINLNEEYLKDIANLEKRLNKNILLFEPGKLLLYEIYLTQHLGQKEIMNYCNVVILILSRIFDDESILENLNEDINLVKNKLKNLKSINEF